jgi:hypothetical protein
VLRVQPREQKTPRRVWDRSCRHPRHHRPLGEPELLRRLIAAHIRSWSRRTPWRHSISIRVPMGVMARVPPCAAAAKCSALWTVRCTSMQPQGGARDVTPGRVPLARSRTAGLRRHLLHHADPPVASRDVRRHGTLSRSSRWRSRRSTSSQMGRRSNTVWPAGRRGPSSRTVAAGDGTSVAAAYGEDAMTRRATPARSNARLSARPDGQQCPVGGYLFYLIDDLSPARLGRGGRRVALSCGCPRHQGVTLIGRAPVGHRTGEWLKRGLPSSK